MKLKWTLSDSGTWAIASCVGHVVTAMSNQANGWWRIGGVEVSGICRGVSLVDMQEAAEAALVRLLAEDEGLRALLEAAAKAWRERAEAAEARVAELEAECNNWAAESVREAQERADRERWIPVSERLPEVGTRTIAVDVLGTVDAFMYHGTRWNPYVRDTLPCWGAWDHITHWRFLPAGPEVEK